MNESVVESGFDVANTEDVVGVLAWLGVGGTVVGHLLFLGLGVLLVGSRLNTHKSNVSYWHSKNRTRHTNKLAVTADTNLALWHAISFEDHSLELIKRV